MQPDTDLIVVAQNLQCHQGALFVRNALEDGMSFFAWICLGLLAGFITSHLVNHRGEGMVLDILLGIVGAIIGGWVFQLFGARGVTSLNAYSLAVAVTGSILFLVVYHAIRRSIIGRRAL